jgi:hypothetical protein
MRALHLPHILSQTTPTYLIGYKFDIVLFQKWIDFKIGFCFY